MPSIIYNGLNNSFTYESWQGINAVDSQQYQLKEDAGQNFDAEGFGKIDGRYVVALTSHYGDVGDLIDFVLYNGNTLPCIIGDVKSSGDRNWNEYGHELPEDNPTDLNVIEFIVDYSTWYQPVYHVNPGTPTCHPEWAGQLQSYTNIGSYWDDIPHPEPSISTNLLVVEAERRINDIIKSVWYLATFQKDGFLYFNDDKFWRCDLNGEKLQYHYFNKDIWVDTENLKNIKISEFKGSSSYSSGIIAPNANVETAVQWMINKANSGNVAYSMDVTKRNLKNPDGDCFDCSSFVITGFYVGGFDANATSTHNMKSAFQDLGFTWIPSNYIESNACIRGDILLREYGGPGDGHTNVYIGNNQDVDCGSPPAAIVEHSPNCWGDGWDGILRFI